ncbi:hypothetical protein GCM10009665_15430 [Kitasatospora nipponensis]|uniref:HTH luxR-type domain-containing protein n=1 Tax=Kitasatospora nipponensis TaxID=258049 RepID=A0ABN1VWW0_9ACTN
MTDATDDPRRDTPAVDDDARALYLRALENGGRLAGHELAGADHDHLRRLVRVGLMVGQPSGDAYFAISPRAVTLRLGAEMRAEAVRLLTASELVDERFDDLTRAYDQVAAVAAGDGRPAELRVHGWENIQKRIAQLLSDCRDDLITVQPGHRPPEMLESALGQDIPFLERGGTLRTLYQPSALSAPATVQYAAEVTRHGGTVRVLDEPFQRTIILDRRIAVIPAVEDTTVAVFVEEPAVVAHLIRVFERDWERAESVRWTALRGSEGSEAVVGRVGTLLAQGLTQQGVARRLGLSERTVAGHIARLRNRYGARTLFQLGWLMRTAPAAERADDGTGESAR